MSFAQPRIGRRYVYPSGKVDVDTLKTKGEIARAFWALTCRWGVHDRCLGCAGAAVGQGRGRRGGSACGW